MDKELRKIVKRIEANGFVVVPGGKHFKVQDTDGNTIYTLPGTPSGQVWRVRLLSELRKRGIIE
jgi:hypothetical protein